MRSLLLAAGLILLPTSITPTTRAAPIAIGTPDAVSLEFAADARPKSFRVGGKELLDLANPGSGLTLQGYDSAQASEVRFPFRSMTLNGNQLVASLNETSRITFEVKAADRYVALRLKRVEGIPQSNLLWLRFHLNVGESVKCLPLDFMTQVHDGAKEVRFPWLWKRKPHLPLGGFALYAPSSPQDEDETLLRLWVDEGLPHPKVSGQWDLATARKWLADWQQTFADQSQMLISASSNQELYQLADYAASLDVKRLYMHTDTWRGEYWPNQFSFLHLNPKVFPKGEEDFKAFADYARSKGIGLTIHTVSCSIAPHDPDYVAGKVDPRLARWIDGTLVEPVPASATVLRFRPNPGQELPLVLDRPVTGPSHVDPWNDLRVIRIGDELIDVARFENTDQEVWTLSGCTRGLYKNPARDHAAGAEVVGLIRPYAQVFTADNDSNLVEELAQRMAGFYNRNHVTHLEQDAGEIHTVNHAWGYARFAEAMYRNLAHPVTSNNSGGTPMPCQLEYRFNSSREAVAARKQVHVPLTLARNGRLATGPYELNASLGKAVASGCRSISIQKPEPMFGISTEILANHGLASLAANTVRRWKQLGPRLTPEQRQTLLASSDDVIFRASNDAQGLAITPLQMLGRPGIEIDWQQGSEFGPIVPRQYLRSAEPLRVHNPWSAQTPEFVIRVMPTLGGGARPTTAGSDQTAANQAEIDSYNIGAGQKAPNREPSPTPPGTELRLQPTASQISNAGDHQFSDAADGLSLRFNNQRAEPIHNAANLPHWQTSASMLGARGIACTVVGDGSNAMLVIQTECAGPRDYVVPLDFTGPREIVIPCGEVSWTDRRWGWRFATKDSHYGNLNRVSMGLGKVPPQTAVNITVRNLRLLPESQTSLKDPVISLHQGKLTILGEVRSESYLWYRGGETIEVCDPNWKPLGVLPVRAEQFVAPSGDLEIRVDANRSAPEAWFECQFFVKGTPMRVPSPPDSTTR